MKKIFFAVAAIATLCACSGEELEHANTKSTLTFTASMDAEDNQSGVTRTSLDQETKKKIFWDEGDAISIFGGTTNEKMVLTSGAGTTRGVFTGTCEKADEYTAAYPYNENNTDNGGNDIKIVWNGSTQTVVKGSFPKGTPMLAHTQAPEGEYSNIDLKFKNLCAYLKFTIDYGCEYITITAKDADCKLTGDVLNVGWNNSDNPTIDAMTNSSNSVKLVAENNGVIEPGTYYVAVRPTTMTGGFSITFSSASDFKQVEAKSTTKNVTLTRNEVLNLGAIDLTKFATTLEGEGTQASPYLIHNFAELHGMQLNIAAGIGTNAYYKQVENIDASGLSMDPIGNADHNFAGNYDGNGKKISNMKYSNYISYVGAEGDDRQARALFGVIKNASIHDLTIENPVFEMPSTTNRVSISPFVAVAHGTDAGKCQLANLTTTSSSAVTITSTCSTRLTDANSIIYGGIIADSEANVDVVGCNNNMETDFSINKYFCDYKCGPASIGGIIGYAVGVNEGTDKYLSYNGTVNISECRSSGKIYLSEDEATYHLIAYLGGIIGQDKDFTYDDQVVCNIKNCVHSGAIECYPSASSCSAFVGGIIGQHDSDGWSDIDPTIRNCINSGNIKGEWHVYIGGILGYCYDDDTSVYYCANSGSLYAESETRSYFPCSLSYYPNIEEKQGGELPSGDYFFDTTSKSTTWKDSGYTFPTDFGYEGKWQNSAWNMTVDQVVSTMNTIIDNQFSGSYKKWKNTNGRCDLDF